MLVRGSQLDIPSLVRPGHAPATLVPAPHEFAEGTAGFRVAPMPGTCAAGSVATPLPQPQLLPSMHELTALARALAVETSLVRAAATLQRALASLLRVSDATCVWIDGSHGLVMSTLGRCAERASALVLDVAASGKPVTIGSTRLQPIGPGPARTVLALRKPPGDAWSSEELALIATLAAGIAPAFARLLQTVR